MTQFLFDVKNESQMNQSDNGIKQKNKLEVLGQNRKPQIKQRSRNYNFQYKEREGQETTTPVRVISAQIWS